jgi:hypothetical protein
MNLVEGIIEQIDRVKSLMQKHKELMQDHSNLSGLNIIVMTMDIDQAKKSLASGDVVAMLKAYKNLEEYEDWD